MIECGRFRKYLKLERRSQHWKIDNFIVCKKRVTWGFYSIPIEYQQWCWKAMFFAGKIFEHLMVLVFLIMLAKTVDIFNLTLQASLQILKIFFPSITWNFLLFFYFFQKWSFWNSEIIIKAKMLRNTDSPEFLSGSKEFFLHGKRNKKLSFVHRD